MFCISWACDSYALVRTKSRLANGDGDVLERLCNTFGMPQQLEASTLRRSQARRLKGVPKSQ